MNGKTTKCKACGCELKKVETDLGNRFLVRGSRHAINSETGHESFVWIKHRDTCDNRSEYKKIYEYGKEWQ
jgi:hypothetical protein